METANANPVYLLALALLDRGETLYFSSLSDAADHCGGDIVNAEIKTLTTDIFAKPKEIEILVSGVLDDVMCGHCRTLIPRVEVEYGTGQYQCPACHAHLWFELRKGGGVIQHPGKAP